MVTLETSFDLSCYYDDNLQEAANAPEDMRQAVTFWESQLGQPGLDSVQRIQLLTRIGGYARVLRHLDQAEQALTTALQLSELVSSMRWKASNSIKLAHVYQWQQRYPESEALFEEAIALCQTHNDASRYLDFAYQHYGKCKFDQHRYAEAQQYFEKALATRLGKGDRALISSTELALETTKQRLSAS